MLARITFQKCPGYDVYQGGHSVELLKEPRWIEHARSFVNSTADENTESPSDMWSAWFESDAPFHLSKDAPSFVADHEVLTWLDFYEDVRYWLACTMND